MVIAAGIIGTSSLLLPCLAFVAAAAAAPSLLPYYLAFKGLGALGKSIRNKGAFLNSIFGESDAELYDEHYDEFIKTVNELQSKTINEGTKNIAQHTAATAAKMTSGARRRAIAAGRGDDVESFILPGQAQAQDIGGQQLSDFVTTTNRSFNNARLGAEAGRFDLPPSQSLFDYGDQAGQALVEDQQNDEYINLLKQINGLGVKGSGIESGGVLPSTSAPVAPPVSISNFNLPNSLSLPNAGRKTIFNPYDPSSFSKMRRRNYSLF